MTQNSVEVRVINKDKKSFVETRLSKDGDKNVIEITVKKSRK